MAISRYRNSNTIQKDGIARHYESADFPSPDDLASIPTFKIRASRFDRLDQLAFKHLGSGEYWWIIALMNDLDWMYGFDPGQILLIPVNAEDVLDLL